MTKFISDKELKKLLKEYTPKEIIYQYTMYKINLSSKQIQLLIKLKDGGKNERSNSNK